jgi:hypothetical protein
MDFVTLLNEDHEELKKLKGFIKTEKNIEAEFPSLLNYIRSRLELSNSLEEIFP